MRICYGPAGGDNTGRAPSAVALGFFDGVHLGHRRILDALVSRGRELGLRTCVYTFVNQPSSVFGVDSRPRLLCDNRLKAEYIAEAGVDELCFDWFDRILSRRAPEEFVRSVLVEKFNARLVCAGENYTFGADGRGDSALLSALGRDNGFETLILPSLSAELDGGNVTVSSTVLRQLTAAGRFREYERLAGHPFRLEGTVVHGREVGRTIGFPTANLLPPRGIVLPACGVYATRTAIRGTDLIFKSITNVGSNPTFADTGGVTVETHLLDHNGALYGAELRLDFLERLRGEKAFSGPDALRAQLTADALHRAQMDL
jgi:riboflavin kinase/FMN adenylyltransferase